MEKVVAKNVDEYIAGFPKETQKLLKQVRATIRKAVPKAQETIKYGMPAYVYHGNLVYFAGYKNHIGFYPVPSGDASLKKEILEYKTGKGSIQFPLEKPMPLELIRKMIDFRIHENLQKKRGREDRRRKTEDRKSDEMQDI